MGDIAVVEFREWKSDWMQVVSNGLTYAVPSSTSKVRDASIWVNGVLITPRLEYLDAEWSWTAAEVLPDGETSAT